MNTFGEENLSENKTFIKTNQDFRLKAKLKVKVESKQPEVHIVMA